jgi:hypothetical protein
LVSLFHISAVSTLSEEKMRSASGSQPSAPQVKLKAPDPVANKKRKLPSLTTVPPLPSTETEEDGGDDFQKVTSRREKPRQHQGKRNAAHQTGTFVNSLFSSVYLEASDKRRLNDFEIARSPVA